MMQCQERFCWPVPARLSLSLYRLLATPVTRELPYHVNGDSDSGGADIARYLWQMTLFFCHYLSNIFDYFVF